MKRFIVVVLLALLLVSGLSVLNRHAVNAASLAASGTSSLSWGGTVHGGRSTFTISNPSIGSGEYYEREISSNNDVSGWTGYAGIENSKLSCSGSPGLFYFFYAYLDASHHTLKCYAVAGGDVNGQATFQVSYFTSNGGGMLFNLTGTPTGDNHSWFDSGASQTFSSITMLETITSSGTGHVVWGSAWDDNQYQSNATGAWVYQPQPSSGQCPGHSGCPTAQNPPQMYWQVYPGNSGTGGELWSCVYSSGTTCQFGMSPTGKRIGK